MFREELVHILEQFKVFVDILQVAIQFIISNMVIFTFIKVIVNITNS